MSIKTHCRGMTASLLTGLLSATIAQSAVFESIELQVPSRPVSQPLPTASPNRLLAGCETIPNCQGVNLQLGRPIEAIEGDLDRIAAAGFKIVRMDLFWEWVEPKRNQTDFAGFDRLLMAMRQRGLRPLLILDYGHRLYPPVTTPEGRHGFATYAKVAAARYKTQPVIWELWNEANTRHFWKSGPDPAAYMALARNTLDAIHQVDPDALVIGPGALYKKPPTNPVDHMLVEAFLEGCLKLGFADRFQGYSVHPYRPEGPESALSDYTTYRHLLNQRAPGHPNFPIVNTEWGYGRGGHISETGQADYLARSMLLNYSAGVSMSVWYNWREGETSLVRSDGSSTPALQAYQKLVNELGGFHFVKRLKSASSDYLLVFGRGAGSTRTLKLAAWTTQPGQHNVTLDSGRPLMLNATPRYETVEASGK